MSALGAPTGEHRYLLVPAMEVLLPTTREAQAHIAHALGESGPEAAPQAVAKLVEKLGLPRRLRDVNVSGVDLAVSPNDQAGRRTDVWAQFAKLQLVTS